MATETATPRKPVVFLRGEIKSPPFTGEARYEVGMLLRLLQEGILLGLPHSRPLPSIGPRCHELRVKDARHEWRIVYRIDPDAIFVASVFAKTGKSMQQREFAKATRSLRDYDAT